MKKITSASVCSTIGTVALSISLLVTALPANAQKTLGQLWGLTPVGGKNNASGVLFNYTSPNNNDSVLFNFPTYSGINNPAYSDLIQAANGTFYGTTAGGGANALGTVFKCSPSGMVTVLVSMNSTLGENPAGGVVMGPDGYLYGLATNGGASGQGTIFKCDTLGNCSAVFNFDYTNFGGNPNGKMIVGKDGKLYGLTYDGGTSGNGVLFSFDTLNNFNIVTNLASFLANGSLIQADDSNLYGMTEDGGNNGYGSIFKCSTSGTLTTIYSFTTGTPEGSLIQGKDKMLYGMARTGGTASQGSVFSCDSLGNFTTLYSFTNSEYPYGSLVQAANGNLYGLTNGGGSYGTGAFFQCTTTGTLTTLVNLKGVDALPEGSLKIGQDGNLYGMAQGSSDYGAIFKCSTAGAFANIFYMGSSTVGSSPSGSLIQAYDGNMYGMTNLGGAYAVGTIFQVTPAGVLTTVASLNDTTGAYPYGSLVQGADSNLYGLSYYGGSSNLGAAFKYNIKTNQISAVVSFTGTNGEMPYGGLVKAKNGTMYGMTSGGGSGTYGTVFKLTTQGALTTLTNFANNETPRGSLIQGTDGNLYGMTYGGKVGTGDEDGFVFVCDTTGKLTPIVGFFGSNGSYPYSSLVQGVDGNLYGMTYGGEIGNSGEIFKTTTKGVFTNLYSFQGDDFGGNPEGSLIQATDSNFYGMTSTGGTVFAGVAFKLTRSAVYDTLFTFNDSNGYQPQYGNLLEYMSVAVSAPKLTCNGYLLNAAVSGGGVGTYTYKWSNGATTSSIYATTGGTYSVAVTNAKGLTVSATSVSVSSYAILTISTASTNNASCIGCNDGSASVNITGGYNNVVAWSDSTSGGYVILSNHVSDSINNIGAGTYVCTVTDSCGSKTDTVRVDATILTGVNNLNAANTVSVYPTPNNGSFTMVFNGSGYQMLNIYSETGRKVYSETLSDKNANSVTNIDLSNFADGIYFAQVITSHGVLNKKIVIQR